MNETKMARALQSVTNVAMRVLQGVPIQEPWSKAQIVGELKRSGSSVSVEVIHGCLENLRGKGLVSEPEPGRFVRVQARPRLKLPAPNPIDNEPEDDMPSAPIPLPAASAAAAAPPQPDPLARLAELAANVRGISTQLAALAERIESVALDVAQQSERDRADGERLRQLQELLKGIANV